MTTRLAPEKVKEIKDYIKARQETNAEAKYIKRDTKKKFSLTEEEWEEYFSDKPKPQTAANRSGTEHLDEALKQPSGKKALEKMAKETADKETAEMLGLNKILNAETIEIRKAKITSNDTLEVEYSTNGNTITIKSKAKIHGDLKEAFEELVPHFAMLCDLKEVKQIPSIFEDVRITGQHNLRVSCISMDHKVPATGVTITGIKQINNNKQITINSPFTEFDSENEPYPFSGYLCKSISKCKDEVIEYLNGKAAEDPQMALELKESEENEF